MFALGRPLPRPIPTATQSGSRTPHRPGLSQARQQQQPGSCAEVHCMPHELCQPDRAPGHLHAAAWLLAGAVSGEWHPGSRHVGHPPSPHRNPCPSPNHPSGLLLSCQPLQAAPLAQPQHMVVLLDSNAAIVSQLKQMQQTKQKFGTQDPGSALSARFQVRSQGAQLWQQPCRLLACHSS